MLHYLSMMMAVSDIFLLLDGSAEAKEKQKGLWQYLREHTSAAVYRSIRFGFGGVTNLPFPKGDASWWVATASHGRSSSSTKFTIVAYNRATACAAALFFCLFRPFIKESSILLPERMLLFRKWDSIIHYCAVFLGFLASSKETRLTEKKEERAAVRRYRAAARNIAWNSFSSAFPWRLSQVF